MCLRCTLRSFRHGHPTQAWNFYKLSQRFALRVGLQLILRLLYLLLSNSRVIGERRKQFMAIDNSVSVITQCLRFFIIAKCIQKFMCVSAAPPRHMLLYRTNTHWRFKSSKFMLINRCMSTEKWRYVGTWEGKEHEKMVVVERVKKLEKGTGEDSERSGVEYNRIKCSQRCCCCH